MIMLPCIQEALAILVARGLLAMGMGESDSYRIGREPHDSIEFRPFTRALLRRRRSFFLPYSSDSSSSSSDSSSESSSSSPL